MGLPAEKHPVPEAEVRAAGLESVTNLVVRRPTAPAAPYCSTRMATWCHPARAGPRTPMAARSRTANLRPRRCRQQVRLFDLRLCRACAGSGGQTQVWQRGTAVHLRRGVRRRSRPGWLLNNKVIHPDLMIAAGFSYQVITAHNGCLQMEVTVHGKMAHAAIPDSGVDAMQAAVQILNALYAQNTLYKQVTSKVEGITHPYLNVGMIEGGTNTNVVPGRVSFKLDRRMIPEENPAEVEATLRRIIADTAASGSRRHGGCQAHAAGQCDAPAAGQPAAGDCDPETRRAGVWREDSRAGHAAVHRRAPVLRGRHPRRDLRRRPTHRAGVATPNAPTSGWSWKTCAAPPRSSRARCTTCWPDGAPDRGPSAQAQPRASGHADLGRPVLLRPRHPDPVAGRHAVVRHQTARDDGRDFRVCGAHGCNGQHNTRCRGCRPDFWRHHWRWRDLHRHRAHRQSHAAVLSPGRHRHHHCRHRHQSDAYWHQLDLWQPLWPHGPQHRQPRSRQMACRGR
jgi:hypothetical protein